MPSVTANNTPAATTAEGALRRKRRDEGAVSDSRMQAHAPRHAAMPATMRLSARRPLLLRRDARQMMQKMRRSVIISIRVDPCTRASGTMAQTIYK